MNTNNFLDYCRGITMVLFSCAALLIGIAALIESSSPAQADAPTMTNSTGKYMMQM